MVKNNSKKINKSNFFIGLVSNNPMLKFEIDILDFFEVLSSPFAVLSSARYALREKHTVF